MTKSENPSASEYEEARKFALTAWKLSPDGKRKLADKAEALWGPDEPAAAKMAACLRKLAEKEERA
jgi:hypothetical protein